MVDEPSDASLSHQPGVYGPDVWVTIATYWQAGEVHIARLKLESENIPCLVDGENIVATDWMLASAVSGIKLKVRDVDEQRSRKLLAAAEVVQPEEFDAPGDPELSARIASAPDAIAARRTLGFLTESDLTAKVVRSNVNGLDRFDVFVKPADEVNARGELAGSSSWKYLLDAGHSVCPACGSPEIFHPLIQIHSITALVLCLLIGTVTIGTYVGLVLFVFYMLIWRPWKCRACGKTFLPKRQTSESGFPVVMKNQSADEQSD